jgi:hypothetical protein
VHGGGVTVTNSSLPPRRRSRGFVVRRVTAWLDAESTAIFEAERKHFNTDSETIRHAFKELPILRAQLAKLARRRRR